jgi:hypothetical protein
MRQRLGEILVEEGSCTPQAVAEALQNQAIFGGRLGTNLLEMGAVAEDVLAFALGRRTGAPALYGDLPPDPKALRLVDKRLAERWDVVPYLLADRRLAVLARDPCDLQMLDEVAFATGKNVHAFVVPEARLWRTLQRAYGVDREHRGLDMGRRAHTPPPLPAVKLDQPDLIEESDFQELYGQLAYGGATPVPGTIPAMPRGLARPAPAPLASQVPVTGAAPPEATPATPAEAAASDALPPLSLDILDDIVAHAGHQPPSSLELNQLLQAQPVARAPEPSALSFTEALRFLEGVEERGAIARTVLRYARSHFARTVLLTIRRGEAVGWEGLGEGLTSAAVHALRLPLGVPGVVETVVASRAPFLGPIQKTWANVRLLKGLGGGVPGNALVVPVVALGRVVNVLYADAGRGQFVDASELGELLLLATRIAQSYDDLARRAV